MNNASLLLWTFLNLFCWEYAFTGPLFLVLILVRVWPWLAFLLRTSASLYDCGIPDPNIFRSLPSRVSVWAGLGSKVRPPVPRDRVRIQWDQNCPSKNSRCLPSVCVGSSYNFFFSISGGSSLIGWLTQINSDFCRSLEWQFQWFSVSLTYCLCILFFCKCSFSRLGI